MSHTTGTNTFHALRLVWPQWEGAGRDMVAQLLPEVPLEQARHGYVLGARVLEAVLPPHPGPTAEVPVDLTEPDIGSTDGIESREVVVSSLERALTILAEHDPERVLTLGGECSVSVAPFAHLAARHGDDLAVIWIDSHPDVGTPASDYDGYHAMAVSALTGHGDQLIVDTLPTTVDASRVALAGLHEWTPDDHPNIAAWGLTAFSPEELRTDTTPLLDWLTATGCDKVAIHFDVDTVDSDEIALGLGRIPGGLTTGQVRRVVDDLSQAADVVGMTVAEFIPRDVLVLRNLLTGMPLVQG